LLREFFKLLLSNSHAQYLFRTSEKEADGIELGLLHVYYRQFSPPVYFTRAASGFLTNQFLFYITEALLTYATTLAYYLHLRTSEKYAGRPLLLRQHPVLNRLLTLKQSLITLENLGVGTASQDEDDEYEDEDGEPGVETPDLWSILMTKGLESDELTDLLMDVDDKPSKTSKADKIEAMPPKKKRKTSDDKNGQSIFDLVEPDFEAVSNSAKKKRSAPADTSSTDAFGEATFLHHADATDKQARKKSLRFHVSRIESATARRQNARVNAVGGDDDIPYRERRKEKEQRMENERQRKAGTLGMGGDDLDDVDPEITDTSSRSKRRRRDVEDDDDSETAEANGYYELVKRQAAEKKSKKKMDYEEARAAER
jgi:U3 small nucleolar RNA-associated protein 3